MIDYHGGAGLPTQIAIRLWRGRHAMISFAYPSILLTAAEVAQFFALDNGAFTEWRQGKPISDWKPYVEWVREWHQHPRFRLGADPGLYRRSSEMGNFLLKNNLKYW